jgi:hypothetical protein
MIDRCYSGRNARYRTLWRWALWHTQQNVNEQAMIRAEEIDDTAHFMNLKPEVLEAEWDGGEFLACRRVQ